jgi:photosystem II stability/assembly factor-like uncharacterized protein
MGKGRRNGWLGVMTAAVAMAAMAVLPGGAGAAVGVGHSGWFWGDPLPQGQSLTALDFAAGRGYAGGDFGTLLRTTDGGATWAGLPTGTTQRLYVVQAVDANTVVAGGGCTVRRSTNGGVSFDRVAFASSEATCPAQVTDLSFVNPNLGFVLLEDGTVVRTPDGGKTFSQRTAVPETRAANGSLVPEAIAFTGPKTGVAILSGSGGRIYRTADGGTSWTLVSNSVPQLRALHFVDATTGFAVGDGGAFLKTTNGGVTFTAQPLAGAAGGQNLSSIDCASATTCLMAVGDSNRLIRTDDGGATSTAVSPANRRVSAAAFASAGRAVAVGEGGTTVVSNDAGVNFAPVGARLAGSFGVIRSVFGSRAYAPGANGRVARTLDGGKTWSAFAVSTPASVADVSFPVPATGFALDTSGTVLRTDNAGDTWQILDTGAARGINAVLALDTKRVLLIGRRGIRRSTNGGSGFSAVTSKAVRRASLYDVDRAGKAVFAWGLKTLALSKDGGRKWSKVRRPKRVVISQVDFLSSRTGYLRSSGGRIYFTRNGGRRWRELTSLGTSSIGSMSFSDAKRGFVAANVGDPAGRGALRTTDGGRSWQPQLVSENGLDSIAASGRNGAVALDTTDDRFYATTSGGVGALPSKLSIKASKRRLRKTATIRVTGRLTPARGGEQVVVAMRASGKWTRKVVTVASNGRFTTRWRIKRSARFVALWRGDDRHAGDGTTSLAVVKSKAKRKKGRKHRR